MALLGCVSCDNGASPVRTGGRRDEPEPQRRLQKSSDGRATSGDPSIRLACSPTVLAWDRARRQRHLLGRPWFGGQFEHRGPVAPPGRSLASPAPVDEPESRQPDCAATCCQSWTAAGSHPSLDSLTRGASLRLVAGGRSENLPINFIEPPSGRNNESPNRERLGFKVGSAVPVDERHRRGT